MDDEPVVIRLELRLAGDSVTGRASGDGGVAHDFVGRLGLLAAIDALLDVPTSGSEPADDPR